MIDLRAISSDSSALFDRLTNWQAQHEANILEAYRRLGDSRELEKVGQDSIYEDYFNKQNEIGGFDFMEGKNPEVEEEYGAQLYKLAYGDFSMADFDSDGKVTLDEFINNELMGLSENDSNETKMITKAYSYLMFNLIDKAMGNSDRNDTLSIEEYESLYNNLDRFNGFGFVKKGDGIISPEAINMAGWLIENVFSADTINYAIGLARQGDI